MRSHIRDMLSNHRRIIVIIVAIAAISSYLAPFDKLMGISTASAQPGKNCTAPGFSHGLKYGIKKHAKCVKDVVKSTTGGIGDSVRNIVRGTIGGTSDSPTQAGHTNNVKPTDSGKTIATSDSPTKAGHTNNAKPTDSGKTIANDVKTKVKDNVQGNGHDTHTAKASSNVKPADSSKPSKPDKAKVSDSSKPSKPDKAKVSDSIKSRIRGT